VGDGATCPKQRLGSRLSPITSVNIFDSIRGVVDLGMMPATLLGFASTLVLCLLVIGTTAWHGRFSLDSVEGVQKFHVHPTPRVGGIPIALSLVLVIPWLSEEVKALLTPLMWAGVPAFLFGTAEDLTKRVGVVSRLLATMVSGLLACVLTGIALTRVDVVGIDTLLAWAPASMLFTAFAIGGIANSINIIDGLNGLASSAVCCAFTGLGLIAFAVGDAPLAGLAILFAMISLGFFVVNWPFGKIFLGDGGAYFLGFALGWIGVLLVHRHPEVSAFAVLLVCVHPVTEVLFSIYRRKMRHARAGTADNLHFHSLIKRRCLNQWMHVHNETLANSMAGILVGLSTLIAVALAQFTMRSTLLSLGAIMLMVLAYVSLYARIVRFKWCSPVDFLFVNPRFARAKAAAPSAQ